MENDYKEFIGSDDWKQIKNNLLEERGLECERCFGTFSKFELRIHHKNYDHEFGFERDEDLMVVCNDCHMELHKDEGN